MTAGRSTASSISRFSILAVESTALRIIRDAPIEDVMRFLPEIFDMPPISTETSPSRAKSLTGLTQDGCSSR